MTVLLVAHGTRVTAGQEQIRALARRVGREHDVRLAYVDVQVPHVRDVAARLAGPAVVVPLLLTNGHHVRVDIAGAVDGADAVVAPALGADGALVGALVDRLAAAGPADAVVLAAAGSSDGRSRAEVSAVAAALPVPAVVAYAASATPSVPEAVRALRAAGARRVVVLAYLLADGRFHRALHRAGGDVVTPPLADHPVVVDRVLCLAGAQPLRRLP
ncbi:sirohydrochlorin chelatase [Asanoa siamensis]|uniref:Sirohydrochlorin ferrochelatase n=1 Tax=Asanoa siamensis TaxID=926357 RepID=A0ABQ4CX17_9ACTN|nr:CbiX/SirB N-terminal domain-containing protein [Asanoa siamensis]GIF75838.1 hypothetical protein Asi02nite_53560 [Asanoa siamensis]